MKKKVNKKRRVQSPGKILKKQFLESIETIRHSKKCIYFGLGIFVLATLIGYFFPIFFANEILEIIEELINSLQGLSTFQIIMKIFVNNTLVSLLTILFGIVVGIFPLWTSIQNGYIIGFVMKLAVIEEGFGVLWRLVPHGIFELPAIFISIGLGLRLGEKVIKQHHPIRFLKEAIRVFVFVVLPLLVVAALIEGLLIGMGA